MKRCSPPKAPDQFVPGPQKKMIGIGQDDLRADLQQLLGEHPLDRPLGADRHERRRLDRPPTSENPSTPGL